MKKYRAVQILVIFLTVVALKPCAVWGEAQEPSVSSPAPVTPAEPVIEEKDRLRSEAVEKGRRGEYAQALPLIDQAVKEAQGAPEFVYDQIVLLSWAQEYAQAVAKYESLGPQEGLPDYVLSEVARSYRFVKNYDKAAELYRKAIAAKPDDAEARKGLAQTLREQAVRRGRDGDLDEALVLMDEAVKEAQGAPEFVHDQIVLLSWAHRPAKAIEKYESLSSREGLADYVVFEVARSYRSEKEYRKAAGLYRDYLFAHPEDEAAKKGLRDTLREEAVGLGREGDYAGALALMDEARKETGEGAELVSDRVVILAWAQEYEEAIAAYESLESKEGLPDYVVPEAARCYRLTKDYDQAIELYKDHLKTYPQDREAIKGLIYSYLDAGRSEDAGKFIEETLKAETTAGSSVSAFVGDVLLHKGNIEEAREAYGKALVQNPQDLYAKLGMSRVLIAEGQTAEAEKFVDDVLREEPNNFQALVAKGEILEADRSFLQAYQHYEKAQSLYPRSPILAGLKYRALMELGCTSLVQEKMAAGTEEIDPQIKMNIAGDEPMVRIRWQEPALAYERIRLSREEVETRMQEDPRMPDPSEFLMRGFFDTVAALRDMEQMEEIVRWETRLERMEAEVPVWTLRQFADAYLYLQQPEAALERYEEVLGEEWDPEGSTRLAIYDTLIELGRYKEADAELEGVDRDTPVQIVSRGILRDNWVKEDVAMKHAWSLMYQDRLAQAQAYLEELLSVAPLNTHTRTALAHTYLWRGWPRRALEEFQISGNLDEEEVGNRIGECYALDQNDRGEEARAKARELLKEFPANKHVQRLNRYFEVQDMRTLTVGGAYSTENPGADGMYWSVRLDQPVKPGRNVFAEYVWYHSRESDASDLRRRWRAGFDGRLNRDWAATLGFAIDENGANAGHFETLTFAPDDHWLFSASYDSYAIDVPLRAAVTGVEAQETSLLARYRASEDFIAETSVTWRDYSDNNQQYVYALRLDKGLTTSAYWKTRLMFDGYAEFNSENDTAYFSPESLYGFYLVPMVEHTWFRRYERALVDRFFVGIGDQWQQGYSGDLVWYVRYEQDYRLSDVLSILVGTTYAQRYYDGDGTKVWTPYVTMKYRF